MDSSLNGASTSSKNVQDFKKHLDRDRYCNNNYKKHRAKDNTNYKKHRDRHRDNTNYKTYKDMDRDKDSNRRGVIYINEIRVMLE